MPEFRFRAAAALELRRRQERTAATLVARAEAALREIRARASRAQLDRERAQSALVDVQCRGTDIATLTWHRNWIVRMTDTAARLAHDVDRHAQVVAAAEPAGGEGRRPHTALERMRERAWVRHQQAEQREELKRLDELARVRHILGGDANESRERDDLGPLIRPRASPSPHPGIRRPSTRA